MKQARLELALLSSPDRSKHLSLISCSFLHIAVADSPLDFPADYHDTHLHHYEFLISLSTISKFFIENQELDCSPGYLVPINPGQRHGIRAGRQKVSYIMVFIEQERMNSIIRQTCGNAAPCFPTKPLPLRSEVESLIGGLISESQSDDIGKNMKLHCMAEQLVIELIRHYLQTAVNFGLILPEQLTGEMKRFQLVIDYMHENYHSRLNIKELSGLIFMNTFYFIRTFKKYFRISPYNYLTKIRIFNASNLLRQTNLPVSEIARRCGFMSSSRFSAVFQINSGLTPVRFRKNCRNNGAI